MNEVKKFGYYLFNKWNRDESIHVFGENLGNHIWGKWNSVVRDGCGDQLYWFMNLDDSCKQKLIDRVNEIYK